MDKAPEFNSPEALQAFYKILNSQVRERIRDADCGKSKKKAMLMDLSDEERRQTAQVEEIKKRNEK